jgi:hypothetical protein
LKFNFPVNKQQAVLFGGAKGASSKYDICDDSYLFKIEEQIWVKLNRNNFLKNSYWTNSMCKSCSCFSKCREQ